jgi:hypothetical protein
MLEGNWSKPNIFVFFFKNHECLLKKIMNAYLAYDILMHTLKGSRGENHQMRKTKTRRHKPNTETANSRPSNTRNDLGKGSGCGSFVVV